MNSISLLKTFLKNLDIDYDEYHEALGVSDRGKTVVLERSIKDRYVNNYNKTFLKAWNGNMDLQFCFDTYAVISYITDYYSKDESGITEHLKEALKESKSKNMSLRQTLHFLKRG